MNSFGGKKSIFFDSNAKLITGSFVLSDEPEAPRVSTQSKKQNDNPQSVETMKTILTLLLLVTFSTAVQAGPAKRAVKKDLIENRVDRREDIRDKREDRRDARHDGGVLDKVEDVIDKAEDIADRREDRHDRRHIGNVRKPRFRR